MGADAGEGKVVYFPGPAASAPEDQDEYELPGLAPRTLLNIAAVSGLVLQLSGGMEMTTPIIHDGIRYLHHSQLVPMDGTHSPLREEAEDRQAFFRPKRKMRLNNTAGVYVPLGAHNLLLVIDKNSVAYGSPEWKMIAATAAHLEACHATLSAAAQKSLAVLRAVIFSGKPARSYADVKPDLFFYDADELKRRDGSLVGPAWAASCIVHDANHVWQHDNGEEWHGVDAEVACWKLQVENAGALGLSEGEVVHLKKFIADPGKILDRATSPTYS
jgi:hypothetical protein